jgi:hypothetical protein
LSESELVALKRQIESFDTIDKIDDDARAIVGSHWPQLATKLPPHRKSD